MQIWQNEIRYSHCLIPRRGPDLFVYTSSSVAFFHKIHETTQIWHPSEQNFLFVHFNKRYAWQYFQGVCDNFGNSGGEGEGGKFWGPILKNPEGRGGHTANPFCGSGMDIFWNHTMRESPNCNSNQKIYYPYCLNSRNDTASRYWAVKQHRNNNLTHTF